MNWDNQLSSILSVADGSVAKMRERLTPTGKFSKGGEDLFPVRERGCDSDSDPPALPPRAPLLRQTSPTFSPGVQWADLASVQSQLQIQSQAIDSLTQRLHDLEREKHSQQCHIQVLQDEVHRLREELRERDRQREEWRRGQSPGAERRMEQWRREVGRELNSLRGHITRATSLGNLEESFSSKLRREELEQLRRELDQLKTRLRRQEEDMFLQQAQARETRRLYEHSCKTLEELTDSYRIHNTDLTKTVLQYSHTQQEVRQIRSTVSELKDEVRSLVLRGCEPTSPLPSAHTSRASPLPLSHSHKRVVKVEEADSDSEDLSLTPSLAEISSDDLSWLEDPALHQKPRARLSIQSRRSDFAGPGSDVDGDDNDDNDGDDDLEDDVNADLGSDLSLDEL
ncbi:centrosomal protein of 128 kDa isoform X1 [Simochromis diagramma]|uniref:centrosomal protein of 128 kDa isoform X1 n=1 Tax=Simochromis diagramma TaxID=43689 RepID=UPI001A7E58D2|nr:centrosomal protein of 128 kDa isoform X1 [Simochromis diagramma]XP_039896146.1 centrosomal protein of 128 kDa isoform X1 [Simochromis diagramma]XP_039896147.1 centrosomal protein of 128 kDa isoform X1 [Simochromis diagramma]